MAAKKSRVKQMRLAQGQWTDNKNIRMYTVALMLSWCEEWGSRTSQGTFKRTEKLKTETRKIKLFPGVQPRFCSVSLTPLLIAYCVGYISASWWLRKVNRKQIRNRKCIPYMFWWTVSYAIGLECDQVVWPYTNKPCNCDFVLLWIRR